MEGLEALIALDRCGTVSEAAISLRLTQSAVSKRLQALQNEIGIILTERDGRKLKLTAEARTYIEKATPLLLELRNLAARRTADGPRTMSLAMADSIASSWGPETLWKTLKTIPSLNIQLHAHRSALIIEALRMGRYQMGLCSTSNQIYDLVSYSVCAEPFVLLNSNLDTKFDFKKPTLTIETNSSSWQGIASAVKNNRNLSNLEFVRMESFQAAYQMAASGFGNALLPVGLVRNMRASAHSFTILPKIRREVSLITRKTLIEQQTFRDFLSELKKRSAFFEEIK